MVITFLSFDNPSNSNFLVASEKFVILQSHVTE
jgi:hypothetical protein